MYGAAVDKLIKLTIVSFNNNICINQSFRNKSSITLMPNFISEKCGYPATLVETSTVTSTDCTEKNIEQVEQLATLKSLLEEFRGFVNQTAGKMENCQVENTKKLMTTVQQATTIDHVKAQNEELRNILIHKQENIDKLQTEIQSLNIKIFEATSNTAKIEKDCFASISSLDVEVKILSSHLDMFTDLDRIRRRNEELHSEILSLKVQAVKDLEKIKRLEQNIN